MPETFRVARVKIKSGRLGIPPRYLRRVSWLRGVDPVPAWLFVIEPGRYRLYSDSEVQTSVELRPLLQRILDPEQTTTSTSLVEVESTASAAVSARLFPTKASPRGPRWRLSVPGEIPALAEERNSEDVFLLFSEGHLELWFASVLRQALRVPLEEALD